MKILAARYPQIFQQILFGDNPDIQFLGVEDTAINVPEHRSDKIFLFRKELFYKEYEMLKESNFIQEGLREVGKKAVRKAGKGVEKKVGEREE